MEFPRGRVVALIVGVIFFTQIHHVKTQVANGSQHDAKCLDVKTGQTIVDFKSPGYPSFTGGDLSCISNIDILEDNIATRVDFIQAEMDPPSFSFRDSTENCESDLVFLRGFGDWAPPPRCGNLTGYSFLIDKHLHTPQTKKLKRLTIHALMASPKYRWHIRVVQILKPKRDSPYHLSLLNKEKRSAVETPVWIRTDNHDYTHVSDSQKEPKYVFNGENTVISLVPWQVSLRVKYNSTLINPQCSSEEGIHFCGGSIIGENLILTASHCFYGISKTRNMKDLSTVKAVVGDTNLCRDATNDTKSFDHEVESVTMHYGYDPTLFLNDLAIVKLKTKIEFTDNIKPIALAKTGEDYSETTAQFSGWGTYFKPNLTSMEEGVGNNNETTPTVPSPSETTTAQNFYETGNPPILQSSSEFIIQNRTACYSVEPINSAVENPVSMTEILKYVKYHSVFDSKLCVISWNGENSKPVSTARGDSGGALVVTKHGEPVEVGVLNYGSPDSVHGTHQRYDSFSSVAFYRSWIDLAILSHESV